MNYENTDSLKNLSKEKRDYMHREICSILTFIQLKRCVDFLDNITTKKGERKNEK